MAPRSENEKYFLDPMDKSRKLFPTLNDAPSKYLSVIIPAYKEVDRLPAMIEDTMNYLEPRKVDFLLNDFSSKEEFLGERFFVHVRIDYC